MGPTWIKPSSDNYEYNLLKYSVAEKVRYVCLHGPRTTGKTEVKLKHLCVQCLTNPFLEGLIARNEYAGMNTTIGSSMKKLFGVDYLKDNPNLPFDLWGTDEFPRAFHFRHTGSTLWLRGLDEKSKKIRGVQPTMFYLNEAIRQKTIDAFADVLGSMSGGRGKGMVSEGDPFFQVLMDTNPDSKLHWVWEFFNETYKNVAYFLPYHFDNNPWLTTGERTKRILNGKEMWLNRRGHQTIDDLLVAYPPGFLRDRNVYGLWVGAEGAVYPYFDDDNLIEELPDMRGPDWDHYRWIDYGDDAPTVCLWAGHNTKSDEVIVYHEYRYTRRLIDDHISVINEVTGDTPIKRTVFDSAHPGIRRQFKVGGIDNIPSHKDKKKEIQAVSKRLYNNSLKFYTGMLNQPVDPRIVEAKEIDKDTITEIGKLIWKEVKTGAPSDDLPDKRCSNHGPDALGYGILDLDRGDLKKRRRFDTVQIGL